MPGKAAGPKETRVQVGHVEGLAAARGTVTELEFLLTVQMGDWLLLFFYNAGTDG